MSDNWDHGYRRIGEAAPSVPSESHEYPVTGMVVEFVEGGYPVEFAAACRHFIPGNQYVAADFQLGALRSAVRILGHEDAGWFNSAMFRLAVPKP